MNKFLLMFLLGLVVGWSLRRPTGSALRERYHAVKRSEPTGPTDFGVDLEGLLCGAGLSHSTRWRSMSCAR